MFRNEAMDATHLCEFHQVEGLVADYNLTLVNLIGTIKVCICTLPYILRSLAYLIIRPSIYLSIHYLPPNNISAIRPFLRRSASRRFASSQHTTPTPSPPWRFSGEPPLPYSVAAIFIYYSPRICRDAYAQIPSRAEQVDRNRQQWNVPTGDAAPHCTIPSLNQLPSRSNNGAFYRASPRSSGSLLGA